MNPKVYVIVLNYRGWEDTIECLESLLKLNYPNFQLVVVDNASGNQSMSYLIAWAKGELCHYLQPWNKLKVFSFPPFEKPLSYDLYFGKDLIEHWPGEDKNKIIFIQSENNNGYSSGNNQGIDFGLSKGDADYFWILNNDTSIPPETLGLLVEAAENSKRNGDKKGIWGSKLLYYHDPSRIQNVGAYYHPAFAYSKITGSNCPNDKKWDTEKVPINHIVGASLFVPTLFVLEVGKLSEDYFLYMEEVDWAVRGRRMGWKVGYCFKARVFHKEGMSINNGEVYAVTGNKSKMADYYWTRNKLLITRKFYPYFFPMVIPAALFSVLLRLVRKQPDRVLLLLKAMIHGLTGKKISPDKLN